MVDPPVSPANIYPSPVEQVFASENLALKEEVKKLQTENGVLKKRMYELQGE